MSVKMEQKIEFVGDLKWVITDEEKLGHSHEDEGEMIRGYIECDDVLIDGESMRDMAENEIPLAYVTDMAKARYRSERANRIEEQGYNTVDPTRPLRFQFWMGELAQMIMQPEKQE